MKHVRLLSFSLITLLVFSLLLMYSCKPERNTAPIATFNITPGYGTTDTLFTFDASDVRDLEDPADLLQVRWDWESDSVFDTGFSTAKIITHKFDKGGTYHITMEVQDTKGLTARYTDFIRVAWNNHPPRASFSISPPSGYMQDDFMFDASASSDQEDNNSDLQARWDFDGDGTWDTEYSVDKVVHHQYAEAGSYEVVLEVKDSKEATGQATETLEVGQTNQPPGEPSDPVPADQATDYTTACTLSWQCVDPESDSLTYDVYFGTTETPPLVAGDIKGAEYLCLPLEYGTTYYWKVVAKDTYDHVVAGPVWSFTTNLPVNEMGTLRDARDGHVYKTVKINDRIWMAENLNYGTMINASSGGDFGDGYQKDNNRAEKYCYNNKSANCEIYGALYQWDESMGYMKTEQAKGLCPSGWHIPSQAEWNELAQYYEDNGMVAGEELRLGGRSGFQALFSGYLIFAERKFFDLNQGGYFWSSTVNPNINYMSMGRSVYAGKTEFQEDTFQQVSGLPIRCVKNE